MQSQSEIQGIWQVGVGLGLLLLAIAVFVVIAIARNNREAKAAALGGDNAGGMDIPLIAAFTGWKGVPWVAVTHSNLAPRLVLYEDDFLYQVVRARRRSYREIAMVDVRTTVGTVNIVLEFRDSSWTFAGNTASREIAAKAVAILMRKGCPLTPRAQALLPAPNAGA